MCALVSIRSPNAAKKGKLPAVKVKSKAHIAPRERIRRRSAFLSLGSFFFFILHESNPSTMLLLLLLLGGPKKRHLALPAVAANISISSPWWLSTGLRLLRAVADVSAEVALESVGASLSCSPLFRFFPLLSHSPTWLRSGWSGMRTGRSWPR